MAINSAGGEKTTGSYYSQKTDSNLRQQSTQKMTSHNISELIESNKNVAQSKSTGKVSRSDRTTELTHGAASHSSALDDMVQIDDGKLRQYQQLIQNVKFQSDEIKVLQGQSEKTRSNEGSESTMTYDLSKMEAPLGQDARGVDWKNRQPQFKSL